MRPSGSISAAAAMDDIYRYQRHVYDATRAFYLLGRNEAIRGLDAPAHGRVLEIACGTGRNLVRIGKRYESVRLFGMDVSEAMLSTARRSLARHGFNHRAVLAAADATTFDATVIFRTGHFDRVLISYALSMIPDWREAIRRATSCLAENGSIHIVDFGDFGGYPSIARHIQLVWLRRFSVVPISEFETKLATLADGLGLALKTERLYGRYATLAVLRRI